MLLRNLLWFVFLCRSETFVGSRLQLPAPDLSSRECQVNFASRPEEDEMFLTPRAPTHPSPELLNRTGINLCRQYIKRSGPGFPLRITSVCAVLTKSHYCYPLLQETAAIFSLCQFSLKFSCCIYHRSEASIIMHSIYLIDTGVIPCLMSALSFPLFSFLHGH